MSISEPTNIGLSDVAHEKLKRLKEDGHFKEMADAYRFAIGLALAQGITPPELLSQTTVFGVSTIDPDQSIKNAIQTILSDKVVNVPIYKMAERLADWGIQELAAQADRGEIDFVAIFDQLNALSGVAFLQLEQPLRQLHISPSSGSWTRIRTQTSLQLSEQFFRLR